MSNFSKFFNRIYELRNSSIKNRKDFLTGFFNAAGRNEEIFMSDESLKSICNGIRNLSEELMKQFPVPSQTEKEKEYLMDTLNKNRVLDFFDAFEINYEEKQNYELLCKAIAMQFENFMKYGDIAITSVKSIYEYLLDSILPKEKDNNKEALLAAKTCLLTAIESFGRLENNKPLNDFRGHIDNVFSNIFSSFKGFEKRCNHNGLSIYKKTREDMLIDRSEIKNYLAMVSEPGALPLPLENEIDVTIYDNEHFGDFVVRCHMKPDRVFDNAWLIYALEKSGVCKEKDIYYFTEEHFCHLENSGDNLIPDLFYTLCSLQIFWNTIENELGTSDKIQSINKRIIEKLRSCRKAGMQYYYDGTFYPKEKRIVFDSMKEHVCFRDDGLSFIPEDIGLPIKDIPVIQGTSFQDRFMKYTDRVITAAMKPDREIPTECILVTNDDECHWFIFLSESIAARSRKIRKIEKLIDSKGAKWFFWTSILKGKELAQNDTVYLDKMDKETYNNSSFLCTYGCDKSGILSCCILEKTVREARGQVEYLDAKITNDPFLVFLDSIFFKIAGLKHERN